MTRSLKSKPFKYFLAYKPYGMLTQFTDNSGRKTLADLYDFPQDVYSVGRLDMDSEGLILLTNDKSITDLLLNPKFSHEREYLVQVEGVPNKDDLKKLEKGVIIEGRKTLPAKAKFLEIAPQFIEERIPPIRERKNIPVSWISLALIEGKNRQVRKMTASIGFPTLRLIRFRIGKVQLNGLRPGQVREIKVSSIHDII